MKKVINQVIMIIVFSATVLAQPVSKEIPKQVADAFAAKYPSTEIKNWKVKNDAYVVKFDKDDRNHFAFYSANGSWLRTETSYGLTHSLPEEVKNGWRNCSFKAWGVEAIKHIESAEGDFYIIRVTNTPIYDAEHQPEKETFDLYFSKTGEMVKKAERFWRDKNL